MKPEFFRSSIRRAFEKIGYQRGAFSESLAKVALKNLTESVDWITNFRKADEKEDKKRGIDFVIETDVGNIFLQIKSSQTGKESSLKKHPRIPVVVIDKNESLEEIQRKITETISTERDYYLSKKVSVSKT